MERMQDRFHTMRRGWERTREDGLSAPFSISIRKYLTFLVLIRKNHSCWWDGERGGGEIPEGGDVGLPVADSC